MTPIEGWLQRLGASCAAAKGPANKMPDAVHANFLSLTRHPVDAGKATAVFRAYAGTSFQVLGADGRLDAENGLLVAGWGIPNLAPTFSGYWTIHTMGAYKGARAIRVDLQRKWLGPPLPVLGGGPYDILAEQPSVAPLASGGFAPAADGAA